MSILQNKWFKFLLTKPIRFHFIGIFTCLIISITFGALTPKLIRSFYNAFNDDSNFTKYAILLGGLFILEYCNRVIYQLQVNRFIEKVILYVRGETYSIWLRSYEINKAESSDDSYPLGEVMARIMNDSDSLRELITSGAFGIIIDLGFIISCLISFVFLNTYTGVVLMIVEVSVCIGLIWGSKYMAEVFLAVRAASGHMARKIANLTAGMSESFYNPNYQYASKSSLKAFKTFLRKQLLANVWDASYYSIAESLFPLLLLIIVLILPYSKITEVATIVAIIDLIQRSIGPIKEVAGKVSNIQRAATGMYRINSFVSDLEQGGLSQDKTSAIKENIVSMSLEIDQFSYPQAAKEIKTKFRLSDISLSAKKGDYIGILGHSGSGKSTILNLAAMNICPANLNLSFTFKDEILKLEHDSLDNIGLLKSQIGLISQDSHVFTDTLAFNITLDRNYDKDKFKSFWRDMLDKFPYLVLWGKTPDDIIELDKISLGQKQIISALRICYQNKPIVLFDEISSSLDSYCEEALRGIIKLKQLDSIVWVVTHRVESVMEATKIVLMNDGRIAGLGDHENLAKTSELYGQFLSELRS